MKPLNYEIFFPRRSPGDILNYKSLQLTVKKLFSSMFKTR